MRMTLSRFLADDDGAVTVDWAVLTAIAVAFGVIVLGGIVNSAGGMADTMESSLAAIEVVSLPALGSSR